MASFILIYVHLWWYSCFVFLFLNFIYFLYSRFLLVIYFIHISVYMSIPISQFISPPPPPHRFPPLVSIRLSSTSVSLFLPCKLVHRYSCFLMVSPLGLGVLGSGIDCLLTSLVLHSFFQDFTPSAPLMYNA